jgi:hypothetical protein
LGRNWDGMRARKARQEREEGKMRVERWEREEMGERESGREKDKAPVDPYSGSPTASVDEVVGNPRKRPLGK